MNGHRVQYLWNPDKAAQNEKTRGATFEEAIMVFDDPLARVIYDEDHSEDEHREIVIGYSNKNRLSFVSFHEREPNFIRIISARPATRKERKDYEEKEL